MADLRYGLPADEFIRQALKEDEGNGDHSSLSTVAAEEAGIAKVRFKEDGILSGIDVAETVCHIVDPNLSVRKRRSNGRLIEAGEIVMEISGSIRCLLKAERLLLNFLQRMSGVATLTSQYVKEVAGSGTVILDTRKTTPNFRLFEKRAVVDGGGQNHRHGLYDMIMIKDNHVDCSGGIRRALVLADLYRKEKFPSLKIEIETRNLEEVKEVLETGLADRIMLDNFRPALLREAVGIIGGTLETEASGGITLSNVAEYAETGVNFISVGALTHSYRSIDISMKVARQ